MNPTSIIASQLVVGLCFYILGRKHEQQCWRDWRGIRETMLTSLRHKAEQTHRPGLVARFISGGRA